MWHLRLVGGIVGGVAGVVVTGLVLWVALGPGAVWVLAHADGVRGLEGAALAEAIDRVRGRAVSIGTGLFAVAAIYFTARTAQAALDSSAAARQTAVATEQGQVTTRYTAAIEQLGSATIDIRLGGIYALERIARDSARDHPTVMAVLAAFLREHSHDDDAHSARPGAAGAGDARSPRTRLRPDLQAALSVMARRDPDLDVEPLDLTEADLNRSRLRGVRLPGAHLRGTDLRGADLTDAQLQGADLGGANLRGALLAGADLTEADLRNADLSHADLRAARLRDAAFRRADLTSANLAQADLTNANLGRATLRNARLPGADLSQAHLAGADLEGADLTDADLQGTGLPEPDAPEPPAKDMAVKE
ncbi:uncharacterized protein YjbI with pentapeptide repeats [Actinocorallia herbida]|uniref:Uncharacterized protein YjbI with pentapeptide repeats n=1 Tax=Actinocorallia herbida TaxID=58109 RepID=A0A3N1CVT2_9ACTN|nr:pentapeptide repeat-containing protein [Actinocorallia herbida]ROO85397.1 uncharacterized protein YjbI with pentapeptide repeats [Actinocorallia herbida]